MSEDGLAHLPRNTRRRARHMRSVFRTQHALELAARGFTSEQIADRITAQELKKATGPGITKRGVDLLIRRALERYEVRDKDTIEHVRAGSIQRLLSLEARLWKKAADGNLRAVDRVLAIERQLARITGIEEPPASRQNDRGGVLNDDDQAVLDRLERSFRDAAREVTLQVTMPAGAAREVRNDRQLPSAGAASFPVENADGEAVERPEDPAQAAAAAHAEAELA